MSDLGLESIDLIVKTQLPINFRGSPWVFRAFSPTHQHFTVVDFLFSLEDVITGHEAS